MTALTCSIGLALFGGSANAATIYLDDFSGLVSTNLNGTAPDTRPGTETWTATNYVNAGSPGWRANGSIAAESSGTVLRGAFLPFTPTTGNVYTYSLDMNTTSATSWLAMGFTAGAGLTTDFYGATTVPAPWLLDEGAGNTGTFLGTALAGSVGFAATNAQHSYAIVLDTTAALWTATWFRDSVQIRTDTYTTNPTINYIGIYKHDDAAGTVDNLSLTVVPEPGAALLGGLGLLALLRRRRN